jgi:hypothetical protein
MFAREPSTVVERIQHLDDLISLDLLLHLSSERHSRWNTSGFSGSVDGRRSTMSSLAETAEIRFKTLFSEKLKARQWRRQETSSLISFAV